VSAGLAGTLINPYIGIIPGHRTETNTIEEGLDLKICPICGNKIHPDWIRCTACGARLSTENDRTKTGLIFLIIMMVLNIVYVLLVSFGGQSTEMLGATVCVTLLLGFIFLLLAFHYLWKGRFEYGPDYTKNAQNGQWLIAMGILLPIVLIMFTAVINIYLICLLGLAYIIMGIGFYLMLLNLVPESSVKFLKMGMIFGIIAGIIISIILYMGISEALSAVDSGSTNLPDSYYSAFDLSSVLGTLSMIFFMIEAVIALNNLPNLEGGDNLVKEPMKASTGIPSPVQVPAVLQFSCPTCQNVLRINDMGATMSVKCPFCSTMLTVQSRKNAIQKPTVPQGQIQISCPGCKNLFAVIKTQSPMNVQCPSCGVTGTYA
jgi:phage FluMu protein Com/predicted nucleic acid-binding Zn ribbon protein